MGSFAVLALLLGAITLGALYLWIRQREKSIQTKGIDSWLSTVPMAAGDNQSAIIVANTHGQILHLNDTARRWLGLDNNQLPDLERIARMAQPSDNFLNLFTGETQGSFQIRERWVEATSHYIPMGEEVRAVMVLRPLSTERTSAGHNNVMDVSLAMNVINDIGETVDTSLGVETVLQLLLEIINGALPSDAGEICLWDAKTRFLRQRGWIGDTRYLLTMAEMGGGYKVGEGVGGWVVLYRQPLLITGRDTTMDAQTLLHNIPYRSAVAIPLSLGDTFIGTLAMFSEMAGDYDQGAVALLQAVSKAVGTSIYNTSLYAQQEQRIRDIASLQQIAEQPKGDSDATAIFAMLNERMAKLLDAEMCGVFLYDEERNVLTPQLPFYGMMDAVASMMSIPLPSNSPQRDIWESQPYWVSNDLYDEPLSAALGLDTIIRTVGIRTTAMFPMQIGGERIGFIAISNKRGDSGFTPADIQSLRVLATQAAIVVENVRLYQRERLIDSELVGLQEMTHAIGALSHEGEFYAEINERIARLTQSSMCGILLYDRKARALIAQMPFYGIHKNLVEHYQIPVPPGSVMDELWQDDEFWYSNKVESATLVYEAGLDQMATAAGVEKTLIAVMAAGGRRIGVVQISNKTDGSDYSDKDARLLQIFATQAAAIVENARLYREVKERADQAEGLRRIAEMASSIFTPNEPFTPVLEEVARFMGSPRVFINVIDQATQSLVTYPRYVYGLENFDEPILQDIKAVGYEHSPALSGEPFISNDVPNDANVLSGYRNLARRYNINSTVVVPLVVGERALGELAVTDRTDRPYNRDDVTALGTVGAQIAAALERLLLFEATGENLRHRMEELDAIARVSNELAVTIDIERVLNLIRAEAESATNAEASTIVLLLPPSQWRVPGQPEMERRLGGTHGISNVLAEVEAEAIRRHTDPVLVADYTMSVYKALPVVARSAVVAPIVYADDVVGVLHLYHSEARHFSDRAAGFLMTLAAKAALGIQNYQYYEQQMERGNRLRQRVDQLNRIFELGQMLQTTTDEASVLEAIAYSVQQAVGYDTVLMTMVNETTNKLYRMAHAGLPLEVFEAGRTETVSLDALQEFLNPEFRNSESYFFPIERVDKWYKPEMKALSTAFKDARTMSGSGKDAWRDGDVLMVQITGQGGNLVGVMVLDRPHDNHRPDRQAIEVLEIFAHQAATMVENTRLFAESRRSAQLEARLNDMLNAIASTLDLEEIGRAIAEGINQLVAFHRLTVVLAGGEGQPYDYIKVQTKGHNELDVSLEQRKTLERTALGRSFDEQKDYLYEPDDPAILHYEDLKAWYATGEKSSLIMPLIAGGECLGVLHIGSKQINTLAETDIYGLLTRIARLASSTVQNARLFNQAVNLQILNRSVVESIQQGIVVLDHSGRIISVNAFMQSVFGWDENSRLQDLFAYRPELSELLKDDLRAVLEQGVPREKFSQTVTNKDGGLVVQNFYIYPLRYGEQIRGAVLLVEDVTERTKLEEAMEARANQLAALTDVSTRITASLERNEVLTLALEEMGWIIPFDAMSIWRRNGSFMVLEGRAGWSGGSEDDELRVHINTDERVDQMVESQRVFNSSTEDPQPMIKGIDTSQRFCSWMGVPLVNQGHVVGMMVLAKEPPGFYGSREEQNVALSFASQVAIALANADLFEQTFERMNEVGTLLEASQATALARDVGTIFRTVAELMFGALDMEVAAIMIWDEVDNELQVEFAVNRRGEVPKGIEKGKRYGLLDYPARQRALRQREVIVIVNKERDPDDETPSYMSEVDELQAAGFGARMLVPLVVSDTAIGLIQLEQTSSDEQTLTQQKVRLARALGAQVAVAIENARLSTETTNRFEELLTINQLSQAISSTLKLADMLPIIQEQVPLVTKAEEMYLALYEPESQMITFPLSVREGKSFVAPPRPLGTDEVSYIIRRKHSLSIGADYFSPDELRRSMGITNGEGDAKSYMGVPLKSGDQVLGVLAIRNTRRSRAFSLNDERILTTVGSQLGAAIQNARLFEETRNFAERLEKLVLERTEELEEERDRLDTLYQITSELARTLDMTHLLDRALGMVSKAVGAEDGVILLSDPATDKLYCRAWLNPANLRYTDDNEHPTHPAAGLAEWLLYNSDGSDPVAFVEDLNLEAYWDNATDGQTGLRSALAVVLETNEDPMGVMVLLSKVPGAFTETHLKLLVPAANQVAASINSADLYHLIRDQADRLGKLLRGEQEEAQKNTAILESIADGVMLADANGIIVLFNSAAERILQVPREQAIGQPVTSMMGLYGASANQWLTIIQEWSVTEKQRPESLDDVVSARIELQDRVVSAQLSPVYTNETFLGTVSVFRDITKDVEADRLKNEFIERVSHEFRTPLTPIKGYTDLLLMGAGGVLEEAQAGFVNVIKDNVDRLTILVNDVLNIAKVTNRKFILAMQYLDMGDIIPMVVDQIAEREGNKSKHLTVDVSIMPNLPRIRADRDSVIRILHHIVDNAFNYTLSGGKITVHAEPEITGQSILITIVDTGLGIPKEFKDRAWRRFERYEEHALMLDVAGTGLGLPLVKELVELHHGTVWFESEEGQGTTFFVRLPLEQPNYVTESVNAVQVNPVSPTITNLDNQEEFMAGD